MHRLSTLLPIIRCRFSFAIWSSTSVARLGDISSIGLLFEAGLASYFGLRFGWLAALVTQGNTNLGHLLFTCCWRIFVERKSGDPVKHSNACYSIGWHWGAKLPTSNGIANPHLPYFSPLLFVPFLTPLWTPLFTPIAEMTIKQLQNRKNNNNNNRLTVHSRKYLHTKCKATRIQSFPDSSILFILSPSLPLLAFWGPIRKTWQIAWQTLPLVPHINSAAFALEICYHDCRLSAVLFQCYLLEAARRRCASRLIMKWWAFFLGHVFFTRLGQFRQWETSFLAIIWRLIFSAVPFSIFCSACEVTIESHCRTL